LNQTPETGTGSVDVSATTEPPVPETAPPAGPDSVDTQGDGTVAPAEATIDQPAPPAAAETATIPPNEAQQQAERVRAAREAQEIQSIRHEISKFEKKAKRPLTQEEKDILAIRSISKRSKAREGRARINRTLRNLPPNIRDRITLNESGVDVSRYLGRELTEVDKKTVEIFDKCSHLDRLHKEQAILRVLLSVKSAIIIRSVLHKLPHGLSLLAGSMTGALVGGVGGYLSALQAEHERVYSTQALVEEYNSLKNETNDPENERHALAFLQSILEPKGPMASGKFHGNLSELLDILAFYKKEANGFFENQQINQTIINQLSTEGLGFVKNYQEVAKASIDSKKLWTSAKRGAMIGAGLGLASDLIGAWISHAHAAHAHDAYTTAHSGTGHETNLLNEQPPPQPSDMAFDPQHAAKVAEGLAQNPSDYGNALAHAVRTGFQGAHGTLHLPSELASMPQDVQHNMLQQFIHDLNYTQPTTDNAFVGYHNTYNFNNEALQHLLDKAFHGASYDPTSGMHLDPQSYLGSIVNADQYLTSGFAGEIARGAAEAGVAAATETAATGAAIGASIGLATGIANEKDYKRHETSLVGGGGDGGGNGPAAPEPAPAAAQAAQGAAEQPPAPQPENRPPAEEINWETIAASEEDLTSNAEEVFESLATHGWEELDDKQKKNLKSLLAFAKSKKYTISLKNAGGPLGTVQQSPIEDSSAYLILKKEGRGAGPSVINLKDKAEVTGMKLASIKKAGNRN